METEHTILAAGAEQSLMFQRKDRAVFTFRSTDVSMKTVPSLLGKTVSSMSIHTHSVVCTEQGECFTWGIGKDYVLGHGDEVDELEPRRVQTLCARVVGVAAGARHTACCTHDGKVLTWGFGSDGQLGQGSTETMVLPHLVQALDHWKVVAVAAGSRHTMCLTQEGCVFTFGAGAWGVLGHGDEAREDTPRLVEALEGVICVSIAAGTLHSVVTTAKGEVFTWGYGAHGRLGYGGENSIRFPRLIETLKGKTALSVSAGDAHSVALTENGEVFTWGLGLCGQLGHDGTQKERIPRVVDKLASLGVCAIAAGHHSTAVYTRTGDVVVTGCDTTTPHWWSAAQQDPAPA